MGADRLCSLEGGVDGFRPLSPDTIHQPILFCRIQKEASGAERSLPPGKSRQIGGLSVHGSAKGTAADLCSQEAGASLTGYVAGDGPCPPPDGGNDAGWRELPNP